MKTRGVPFTSLLLVAGVGSFAACSAYDAPLPPTPPVVQAEKAPPAISGGTLIVSNNVAVASDPDRDRVFTVDLVNRAKIAEIALEAGDEPGRLVEDGAGLIHVALRGGGAVATIDLGTAKVVDRKAICAAPRGLAYDQKLDAVHVACAGGELVTLSATGGKELRRLRIDSDLRDVIVQGDQLLVTRFRSAELLQISTDGFVNYRVAPQVFMGSGFDQNGQQTSFEPDVAWRTIPLSNGTVAMVHQRAMTTPVKIQVQGGYAAGGGCDNSIVVGTVAVFRPDSDPNVPIMQPTPGTNVTASVLPVDVAEDSSSARMAVVSAGSGTVVLTNTSDFENGGVDNCGSGQNNQPIAGTPIAVAHSAAVSSWVVQTREPAGIVLLDSNGNIQETIDAGGASVADTGHQMFHTNPGGQSALVCASCHPEGRDDGRTWNFDPIGPRRTPTLGGGVLATAPLHWDGDMSGLDMIMDEVFVKRMGGQVQGPRRVRAFSSWIDALPAFLPNPVDAAAVERGKALFNDATVACASCHSGPHFTNNEAKDVGTGRSFQVPPLTGLGSRAPYMHDGCAATLKDRFAPQLPGRDHDTCGGTKHGNVAQLSDAQVDDLVAFLESL